MHEHTPLLGFGQKTDRVIEHPKLGKIIIGIRICETCGVVYAIQKKWVDREEVIAPFKGTN